MIHVHLCLPPARPDGKACGVCGSRGHLGELELPLVTTWPAFTEAMYRLGRAGGWPGQEALWRLALREDLELAAGSPESNRRATRLMERYADRPMDLADATLVALAEERGLKRIFTIDDDFRSSWLPRIRAARYRHPK